MPPLRGHHEIKVQTGHYALFAVATVELERAQGPAELRLRAPEGSWSPERWRPAVQFGLDYAAGRAGVSERFLTTVTLKAMAVDSTPAVVALAVARAALAALGVTDEPLPRLVEQSVVFPAR